MAGRAIPGKRPRRRAAAPIAAPECPADTTASATLSFTRFIATLIDAFGLRRIPLMAFSSIVTVSSAATIFNKLELWGCCWRTDSIRSGSPTRKISVSSSSAARIAPRTISKGAWSPPIASSAILARVELIYRSL